MKTINMVLLGLDFGSGNFGCAALAYSFLNLLNKIAIKNNLYLNITSVNYSDFSMENKNFKVSNLRVHYKKISFIKEYIKVIEKNDLVFDFTGGDSFTDIYGISRFCKESLLKQIAINKKKKMIIGPQTIGPFNNKFIKKWAKNILSNSYKIYTRDNLSKKIVNDMGLEIIQTTDIAFMLPEDKNYEVNLNENNKIKIGLNISGLLWNGGYTGKNQFELKLDYKELCKKIIEYLLENNYEVHLVAHVFSQDEREDDYKCVKEINQLYPDTIVAPRFNNPMEAKKYFKNMNFFIGSRMHATIGAFSMEVPTISVAYSRKFSGLYNSINYPYVIDGKTTDTEEAYEQILKWLSKREIITENVKESLKIVKNSNEEFSKEIEKIMLESE